MNARKIAERELKENGYHLARAGEKHDIYFNPENGTTIPLRRSFDDQDLKVIRAEIKRGKRKA